MWHKQRTYQHNILSTPRGDQIHEREGSREQQGHEESQDVRRDRKCFIHISTDTVVAKIKEEN